MNPGIRTGSARHHDRLPEKNHKCFFYFFLNGIGIGLNLKSAVGSALYRKVRGNSATCHKDKGCLFYPRLCTRVLNFFR